MLQSATGYIDVAQIVLYAFWVFFAGLIFYLHRENKREGYPLETERSAGSRVAVRGFPDAPSKKTFVNHDGQVFTVPLYSNDRADAPVTPSAEWPGSPFMPIGNPMADGVGPASYAARSDVPELGIDGHPVLVPLRVAKDHSIATQGPNPIGMKVVGADGAVAGVVADAWIDHAEMIVRYLEVNTGTRSVMLPMAMSRVSRATGTVKVASILASQFAGAPVLKSPDSVTKLEEDKIVGYFAGGHLYATPDRMGPLL
jgi:photosynthetic reaction center H subunit